MGRQKSKIESSVEEIKQLIKSDLDKYIAYCTTLQKDASDYDYMILENAVEQIAYLKQRANKLI